MDLGLQGKRAIVFASSQGIGRAIANQLAAEGARVTICARGQEALQRTETEIRARGGEVLALAADVTHYDDIKQVITATIKQWGGVDILVTNAGGPPSARFMEVGDELWQAGINLNLMSTIRMCREVIPLMQAQKWGRIIHITSTSVREPFVGLVLSNVARSGVMSLNKTIAQEYAPFNITSNNLLIGAIWTKRSETNVQRQAKQQEIGFEEAKTQNSAGIPAQRFGSPEEVGALAAFLASEHAGYITGQNIAIDGGLIKGVF
jgi:3-oxoacyl-[acyl-carrier protein] reductase